MATDPLTLLTHNEKQEKVIKKLLDAGQGGFEGGLTNKKYRVITKISPATANRHIVKINNKRDYNLFLNRMENTR